MNSLDKYQIKNQNSMTAKDIYRVIACGNHLDRILSMMLDP